MTHTFEISTMAIDIQAALQAVNANAHGAVDMFIGTVRNHNLGRAVDGIDYDVFDALALNTFADISQQACAQWGALRIFISHFKGYLPIGGISIVIAVSSPHRDEAFQACRFLIEAIKRNAPVWKQEHYVNGEREWVKGHSLNDC
ncbi:MAG: molybdenum cofactor biosynthesis protein MoaE [Formosimonas sp.]